MRLTHLCDDVTCAFNILENLQNVVLEVDRSLIRDFISQHLHTGFGRWIARVHQKVYNHHTIIKVSPLGSFKGKHSFISIS